MAKEKVRPQKDDDDVSPEELQDAMARIARLEKRSQQLEDLERAADSGDHKLVFSKLGVDVSPLKGDVDKRSLAAPQPAPQPEPQYKEPPQRAPNVEPQPFDDDVVRQFKTALVAQSRQLQEMRDTIQAQKQDIQIARAELEHDRLQSRLSSRIGRAISSDEYKFLKHLDPSDVSKLVLDRINSFKNDFGQEISVERALKEIDNSYKEVYNKFTDEIPDDEDEDEGQDYEDEEEDDDGRAPEVKYDNDKEVVMDDEKGQDRGEMNDRSKPRVIKGLTEEEKEKELEGLIDEHMEEKYGDGEV